MILPRATHVLLSCSLPPGVFTDKPCVFANVASIFADIAGLFTHLPRLLPHEPGLLPHEPGLLADQPGVFAHLPGVFAHRCRAVKVGRLPLMNVCSYERHGARSAHMNGVGGLANERNQRANRLEFVASDEDQDSLKSAMPPSPKTRKSKPHSLVTTQKIHL